jgi:hypothetical protein
MHSLTSVLDGGEQSASCPSHFTPRERAPVTHWIGGWVGPRAILDAVVKRKIKIYITVILPVILYVCNLVSHTRERA